MDRRTFLATAGTALASTAVVGTAAAESARVDLYPSDIILGETSQSIGLAVLDVEEADRVSVRIDVTRLRSEAAVDLTELDVDLAETEFSDGSVADATVHRNDRVMVELVFDIPADVDAFRGATTLVGLDTDGIDHTPELRYEVAVATREDEPTEFHESDSFAVEDPAQREPELDFLPDRLEFGATEQLLSAAIDNVPTGIDELVVDVDVTAVAETAGVGIETVAVDRFNIHDGEVVESTILDQSGATVVRLVCAPDSGVERVRSDAVLTGLETEGVEPIENVPYYARLSVDDRPETPPGEDPDAIEATFDVVDPDEIDERTPVDEPQPEPDTPQEHPEDGTDGEPTDDEDTEIGDTGVEGPGFGVLAALLGGAGALAARARLSE